MESNRRYYQRRADEERLAASRAITDAARERHDELAALFEAKARHHERQLANCPQEPSG